MHEIKRIIIDTIKEEKKTVIAIFIILAITIVIVFVLNAFDEKNKILNNKDYVFTEETVMIDNLESSLPYLNLLGDDSQNVSEEIYKRFYELETNENGFMYYEYYKNKNVLSLIVKVRLLGSDSNIPDESYYYNFDIKNKKLLDSSELLELFNITPDEVYDKMLSQVKEYYDYELEKGYISDCDFDCYKMALETDVLKTNNYYVKDGSLFVNREFYIDYNFAYDENNPFDLFNFKITN